MPEALERWPLDLFGQILPRHLQIIFDINEDFLADFHAMWPEKFSDKTNGVTPRRFMVLSNPALAALVTEAIGDGWVKELEQLRWLEPMFDDAGFRHEWRTIRLNNKRVLAAQLRRRTGVIADPAVRGLIRVAFLPNFNVSIGQRVYPAADVSGQARVDAAYRDPERWTRMSILNVARAGAFSSDRTIREYASDIWKVSPVPVRLLTRSQVRAGFLQ